MPVRLDTLERLTVDIAHYQAVKMASLFQRRHVAW